MNAGKFCLAKDIETIAIPFGSIRRVVRPSDTGARQIVLLEGEILPGQGHAFHQHPHQEEVIYVLSGRIEQWLEDQKLLLEAGDAIFVAPGTIHASFNAGQTKARILAVFGPCVGDGFETIEVADKSPWKDLRAAR